ncbi:hypothetical protein Tco_0157237 [Tanacetum coccineum]
MATRLVYHPDLEIRRVASKTFLKELSPSMWVGIDWVTLPDVENLKTIKIVVETDDLRKTASRSLNPVRISCASLRVLELRKLRAT